MGCVSLGWDLVERVPGFVMPERLAGSGSDARCHEVVNVSTDKTLYGEADGLLIGGNDYGFYDGGCLVDFG